ncbi:MAG: hypothetical protein Q4C45_00455 [Oscillospiraceae bacterium]|nr:hypothetical protein [Oscillospiraceae bacterium]
MKAIARNWKAVLAVLLAAAAVLLYFMGYRPRYASYVAERDQLNDQIAALQATIAQNEKYKDVQDQLEPATEAIGESRAALYDNFPSEMREEDQLLYLLYLEETLGTGKNELGYTQELHDIFAQRFNSDIEFSFGTVTPVQLMSDGTVLAGLNLTVYYHASYEDFKSMIHTLAEDERITSIRYATFNYDEEKKLLDGQIVLTLYLMQTGQNPYEEPEVTAPATGKTDIFN